MRVSALMDLARTRASTPPCHWWPNCQLCLFKVTTPDARPSRVTILLGPCKGTWLAMAIKLCGCSQAVRCDKFISILVTMKLGNVYRLGMSSCL